MYQAIIDNAKNAALGDPRFPNVTPDELKDLKVEVSVLTKPASFTYKDTDDLLSQITPAVDGIILRKGHRQSTFLPQVWDQIETKADFLGEICEQKAHLPRDCWKDPKIEIEVFDDLAFEEH